MSHMSTTVTYRNSPPNTAYRIKRLLVLLAGAEKTTDSYRQLIALATELGNEYEVERMTRCHHESLDDEEELREQLIALGYSPE